MSTTTRGEPALDNPPPPDDGARLDALVAAVRSRLARNRQVRRRLGELGQLHVDRLLPFLLLYRRPTDRPDPGTEQLVLGEASHLIAVSTPAADRFVRKLVRALAELSFEQFGSFLLLELWSRPAESEPPQLTRTGEVARTEFSVTYAQTDPVAGDMAQLLANHVARAVVSDDEGRAKVFAAKRVRSPGGSAVMSLSAARELGCTHLGLEVEASYQSPDGTGTYPLMLRGLRTRLGRAIRRTFYTFAEQQTTLRPKNYQVLGRRAVVSAVWEVDRKLDQVASAFEFLVSLNPVNLPELWTGFRRSQFEKVPPFRYRPLRFDPSAAKRQLFSVPIERIEDPTLAEVFYRKQMELDRQITMLADRGTPRFIFESQAMYGTVSPELRRTAEEILEQLAAGAREEGSRQRLNAEQVVQLAAREIEHYQKIDETFRPQIKVRTDVVSGLMVSRGNLLVAEGLRLAEQQAEALIQHEIGTHLVTYHNGRVQRLTQLRSGLAEYEELQEAMAVVAEHMAGGLTTARMRTLAARVLVAEMVMAGAGFIDAFRALRRWGFSARAAFNICVRLYRGSGLTKDIIYLRGLRRLLGYLARDGALEPLLVGKIAERDIRLVTELLARKIVAPPRLTPRYLDTEAGRARLQKLRQGAHVLDLVGQ